MDIEENTIIEAFVRFRFAIVVITSPAWAERIGPSSQLNQRHSDVYRLAENFSRGLQP